MNSKKVRGIVMASIGGIVLLVNAISLIFNLDFIHPATVVIGILFLGVGMAMVRKS